MQGDELVKHGLNLAHAVGKGSKNPPTVVNLTYYGDSTRPNEVDIAFIGKGVCFDAGGLNIKPTGSMETMYMDKAGKQILYLISSSNSIVYHIKALLQR